MSAESKEVTLYAVGDVMLGRYIGKVMLARGSDYPFKETSSVLQSGDIVFGNLEAIISTHDLSPSFPDKPYSFHASGNAAHALKKAGFCVLSLANNHAMDYGLTAVSETKKLLTEEGIITFGTGSTISDARRPAIVTRKGMRFGFLGYSVAHAPSVYAEKNRAGVAPIRMEEIQKDIASLRSQVDVLVVSLHWGMEYETMPSEKQRREAHQIIDWGADLIIGHHPHVMQGIEVYKGRVIAYSLGNFVFDQKGKGTDRSFMLACKFRRKGIFSAEIIPLDRFKTYFPRIAAGTIKREMLEELKRRSFPAKGKIPQLFKDNIINATGKVAQ